VKLVEDTLSVFVVDETPKRLIADRAYDSDPLRKELSKKGIELICPHRKNRKKPRTQDGRKLRRYARRWKVERYFAWLHNYRRCVVRYDFYDRNFEGFILVATLAIYLKKYF
jgi:transposase